MTSSGAAAAAVVAAPAVVVTEAIGGPSEEVHRGPSNEEAVMDTDPAAAW